MDIIIKNGIKYAIIERNSVLVAMRDGLGPFVPKPIITIVGRYLWVTNEVISPDIVEAVWREAFHASAGCLELVIHMANPDQHHSCCVSAHVLSIQITLADKVIEMIYPFHGIVTLILGEANDDLMEEIVDTLDYNWNEGKWDYYSALVERLLYSISEQMPRLRLFVH